MNLVHVRGFTAFADRGVGIRRKDFMAWAKPQSQRIIDHARQLAADADRPYVHLRQHVRKESLTRQLLRDHPIHEGVVCMLRCLEHNPSFGLGVGEGRPRFTPSRPSA